MEDDKPHWLREIEEHQRQIIETSAVGLAHEQQIDALEARLATITDEGVRARIEDSIAHQRIANTIISNQNALRDSITGVLEALLMLAERVVEIEQRLDA